MNPSTPRRAVPRLPPTYWWLLAGVFVMSLATFVFPFLALFLGTRGFSPSQVGLIAGLFGAGSIPAGPIAGHFADCMGRRPTLLVALASAAVFTALLPTFRSPWLIALGTLALGVAIHAYFPAANAVVADVVHKERYPDAFGRMYWARNIGVAVSFAAGGALASRGYEPLFWADAATTLLFAVVVFSTIAETRPPDSPSQSIAMSPGFRHVLADRHFLALMLLNVTFLVALLQFMIAVPLAMTSQGLTPADYGRTMAVNGVLIAILQPFAARVTQGLDSARVLAFAALLVGAGYGAYAWCTSPWQFAAATGVWSLGEILTVPVVSALVAQLSPPDSRGRYQGLFSLSFGLAMAIAPVIGGVIVDGFGPAPLWAGILGLSCLVAAGHLAAGRARRSSIELTAERALTST